MPRHSLFDHRKYKRLCHILQEPEPHVLGYLEYLWRGAYASGDPVIGDALDVELAAKYPGPRGKLTQALLDAAFIDHLDDGRYAVHDLDDHAPQNVKQRWERDAKRKNKYSQRSPRKQPPKDESGGATSTDSGIRSPNSEMGNPVPPSSELAPVLEKTKSSPPNPPHGGECVSAPGEGEEFAQPGETLEEIRQPETRRETIGDHPHLLPVVRGVLAHYREVCAPCPAAKGAAESAVVALLVRGHAEDRLKAAATRYAADSKAADVKRQAPHNFYGSQGSYSQYADAPPTAPPAPAKPVKPTVSEEGRREALRRLAEANANPQA